MYPPESEFALNQTLHYLMQMRHELLQLLRTFDIRPAQQPRHSLFSSRRVFRTDELSLGLTHHSAAAAFSSN